MRKDIAMQFAAEFELYRSEGGQGYTAEPLELKAVPAHGASRSEAMQAAHILLARIVDDAILRNEHLPEPTFCSAPRHGGKIIYLSVERELSGVSAISASRAAEWLGISRSRVGQLCASGALESWREGPHRMVSVRSVLERAASQGIRLELPGNNAEADPFELVACARIDETPAA